MPKKITAEETLEVGISDVVGHNAIMLFTARYFALASSNLKVERYDMYKKYLVALLSEIAPTFAAFCCETAFGG